MHGSVISSKWMQTLLAILHSSLVPGMLVNNFKLSKLTSLNGAFRFFADMYLWLCMCWQVRYFIQI